MLKINKILISYLVGLLILISCITIKASDCFGSVILINYKSESKIGYYLRSEYDIFTTSKDIIMEMSNELKADDEVYIITNILVF